MRGGVLWLLVVLGMVLEFAVEVNAEIYLWTDERGVVHMTDQWTNVPESARASVSVRESSAAPGEGVAPREQEARPASHSPLRNHPCRWPPMWPRRHQRQLLCPLPYQSPMNPLCSSQLGGPSSHQSKKPSSPFPYNVRLDPSDRNFVWVGPNRVPKEVFTYPRVSLDTQAQFNKRLRALEQRRTPPQKTFPAQPTRPR